MKKLKSRFDNMAIKWKIFGYLLLFCSTLLLLLWLSQVVFLSNIYEKTRIKQMVNSAKQIESYMKTNTNLDEVANIAQKNEACVVVLASNGTIIHSTDVQRDCMLHKSSYMELVDIVLYTQKSGGELRGVYSSNNPFEPNKIIEYSFSYKKNNTPQTTKWA